MSIFENHRRPLANLATSFEVTYAALASRNRTRSHRPPSLRCTGAGDTVLSVLALAAAAGASLADAAALANTAAGVVVGKLGTASVTPQELLHASPTSAVNETLKRVVLTDVGRGSPSRVTRSRRFFATRGCNPLSFDYTTRHSERSEESSSVLPHSKNCPTGKTTAQN